MFIDGTNVVFGKVIKGLSVVNEMELNATDDGVPTKLITVSNCGQLSEGENWNYCDDDDNLPPFPSDWNKFDQEIDDNEKMEILKTIKEAGNQLYRSGNFEKSARKYKKTTRYYSFFKEHLNNEKEKKAFDKLQMKNLTNLAATELKLEKFDDVIFSTNAATKIDPKNAKALYRRGLANVELKNYEQALEDLKKAHKLVPGQRAIAKQVEKAKKYLFDYQAVEKVKYRKMFQ